MNPLEFKNKSLAIGGSTCDCPPLSIRSSSLAPPTCTPCPSGYVASLDKMTCLYCPDGIDSSTNDCTCIGTDKVLIESNYDGSPLKTSGNLSRICVTCSQGIADDGKSCLPCPAGAKIEISSGEAKCACDLTTSVNSVWLERNSVQSFACLSNSLIQKVGDIAPLSREFYFTFFLDFSKTLNLYRSTISNVKVGAQHKSYKGTIALMSDTGSEVEKGLFGRVTPLLDKMKSVRLTSSLALNYFLPCAAKCLELDPEGCQCVVNLCALASYDANTAACSFIEDSLLLSRNIPLHNPYYEFSSPSIGTSVSRKSSVFFLATFDLTGHLQSFVELGYELELCGFSEISQKWQNAANGIFLSSCEFSISELLALASEKNKFPVFHELVIGSKANDADSFYSVFSPVPVRILQQVGNSKLVKRFTLFDASNYQSQGLLRFPGFVSFQFYKNEGDKSNSISVNDPLLSILFVDVNVASSLTYSIPVTFISEISPASGKKYRKDVLAMFIVFTVLGAVLAAVLIYRSFFRYPLVFGAIIDPGLFIPRQLTKFIQFYNSFFDLHVVFLFVMSFYWFSKHKETRLLPSALDDSSEYKAADSFLIYLFILSMFVCLAQLVNSARTCLLIIDHENRDEMAGEVGGVSVWRTIFVANEFFERTVSTRTKSVYTFIILLAVLHFNDWESFCKWRWASETQTLYNPFLQIAIPSLIWLSIIAGTIFWLKFTAIFLGDDYLNFVDICSLANVSFIVLDEPTHGWYCHGKAPSGRGDWSATELVRRLQEERDGLLLRRGLFPDDPAKGDLQTFEVLFHHAFKSSLFQIFGEIFSVRQIIQFKRGKMVSAEAVKMAELRTKLQVFLLDAIENVAKDRRPSAVRRRTWAELLTWIQPLPLAENGGLLLEDWSGLSWTTPLQRGALAEWRFVVTELLTFLLTFRFSNNSFLAAGIAYLFGRVFKTIRREIFRKSISRSCGVDERFFL